MIHIYHSKKEGASAGSWDDLSKNTKCWLNCINPNKKELTAVAKYADIPLEILKSVLDPDERPKIKELENYSMITVRAPWQGHRFLHTTPLTILISKKKNNVITIALKELHSIERVEDLVRDKAINFSKENMSYFTYLLLDEVFETYFHHMDIIEDDMNKIENNVVKNPDKVTVEKILAVKKTLIYFNKALTANREVIASVEKDYLNHVDKKHTKHFSSLYAEVSQLMDMVSTNKDIMTSTLEIYVSSVSNNLNQVMKTLTIISSFVLVPTLISGIYGMNFAKNSPFNMPELAWQFGYFFALGLMGLSILIAFIYFKRKGWL